MGLLAGFDNITGWTLLGKNTAALEAGYAASGTDKGDIAYFRSVAARLDTPDKLLKDYRALSFVTTSYGLGSAVNQTALLRKLMTEDPNASTSLAQQLADNKYRAFASGLAFWSPPPFSSQATIEAAVAGFKENSFQTAVGTDNTALQEARYFSQNISGVTKLTQIMADPALLDVVRTTLGIPDAFGSLTYDQQVAILTPRVDLAQFRTADGVSSFVNKYLAMDELNGSRTAAADPILGLFKSGAGGGISLGGTSGGGGGGGSLGLTLSASLLNLTA